MFEPTQLAVSSHDTTNGTKPRRRESNRHGKTLCCYCFRFRIHSSSTSLCTMMLQYENSLSLNVSPWCFHQSQDKTVKGRDVVREYHSDVGPLFSIFLPSRIKSLFNPNEASSLVRSSVQYMHVVVVMCCLLTHLGLVQLITLLLVQSYSKSLDIVSGLSCTFSLLHQCETIDAPTLLLNNLCCMYKELYIISRVGEQQQQQPYHTSSSSYFDHNRNPIERCVPTFVLYYPRGII